MEKNEFEIEKIKAETKSIIVKKYIDLVKGILLIIGSIILFIVIQKPEFVLNKQISKETISRERAKLILDFYNNNNGNPEKMLIGLSIIKKAYPTENNQWLENFENIFKAEKQINDLNRLDYLVYRKDKMQEVKSLQTVLAYLYKRKKELTILFSNEVSGIHKETKAGDTTGFKGYGIRAKRIQEQITRLDDEIYIAENKLKKYEKSSH